MAKWWMLALLICLPSVAGARKFYDDDPLEREPPPLRVEKASPRKISDYYDLFSHVAAKPGEKHTPARNVPAQDVNTIGEVLEGSWYEKRHGKHRMSLSELAAGPGNASAPAEGTWTVVSAKSEGVTPGFRILDSKGRVYVIKFDPVDHPEIATAADVISSKFFYALGYHVPENYIVHFAPSRLVLKPGATFRDERGRKRDLTSRDLGEILLRARRGSDGNYRAVASLLIGGGLNEFRYYGTRSDDPNDIVPHEHRRSLRGLHVFCAWLNHEDSRAINTLDVLVEEGGQRYIKHYLIDFGSTLGSASTGPNSPRSGFEQFFTWKSSAKQFFTFGFYVPAWARIDYRDLPSVGRFTAENFDPVSWTPEYPNPAFDNRLPEDTFWAAEQVMAFTDEEIREIVKTGRYSDPEAERHVADTLIARRNAVGRAYLREPMSLSRIRIEKGDLVFNDLAVHYGYVPKPFEYRILWSTFDNETAKKQAIPDATGATIPSTPPSDYLVADITAGDTRRHISVYVRRSRGAHRIVGIERNL
jgi:hypothetical protein